MKLVLRRKRSRDPPCEDGAGIVCRVCDFEGDDTLKLKGVFFLHLKEPFLTVVISSSFALIY